ncbi:protein of unknown function [Candidatus Nitrosotalea okcheonensis]|uniref:Uncharacterized protein n=1 Tax=Candidatus Nitrosotalea okcheonensis TaxID=1903276 RepID=A0A2H1FD89_9ARCH|nr:protein of unknown function [Candidatus Nitrosotalea okcheonensis]
MSFTCIITTADIQTMHNMIMRFITITGKSVLTGMNTLPHNESSNQHQILNIKS